MSVSLQKFLTKFIVCFVAIFKFYFNLILNTKHIVNLYFSNEKKGLKFYKNNMLKLNLTNVEMSNYFSCD